MNPVKIKILANTTFHFKDEFLFSEFDFIFILSNVKALNIFFYFFFM